MAYRTHELIRSALQHAILERESYLDAIRGSDMPEVEEDCRALIAGWKMILARRYRQRSVSEAWAAQAQGAPVSSLVDVMHGPDRQFKAPPLDLSLPTDEPAPSTTTPYDQKR